MRSSLLLSTLIVALNTLLVKALVADFGQCGGINWKGESQCLPGSFCYWNNDFYSQCFPPPYLTATPTGCVPRPTAGYNPIKASTPGIPVFGLAVKDLPDRNAQLTTEGILGTYEYQITQGLTYLLTPLYLSSSQVQLSQPLGPSVLIYKSPLVHPAHGALIPHSLLVETRPSFTFKGEMPLCQGCSA
ncbi:hypothetical protein FRC02_009892 [Tulasnella sp. 418]|nr:hypothetical protein FRC02_009892 [Tulasnella sp. 418]